MRYYTGKTIYDESHYRKLLPNLSKKLYTSIFDLLRGKNIFLLFDETTDVNGRYILNIMGGICSEDMREETYLLRTVELIKTNNKTVSQEIIDLMSNLYNGTIDFTKLYLILSDAAPYAVKAVTTLKGIFLNLKHVTCLAHMLHRLCKKIRSLSPISNITSSNLKRILVKNKENQIIFKEITSLKLPDFPVITRWGTWLSFMIKLIPLGAVFT